MAFRQEADGSGFEGRVALVTGGSSGIGAAVVAGLVRRLARVMVADLDAPGETGPSVDYVRTDVTRPADADHAVQATAERVGTPDILINAAGIFPLAELAGTTDDLWSRVLGVNLTGPMRMCRAAVPLMQAAGGGAIVNIGSLHSSCGSPDRLAYAVSKGGLVTLTHNLARALAPSRIRVNCVHPGWVLTPGDLRIQAEQGHDEAWLRQQSAHAPLGRTQEPEEVAAAVIFLAGPDAAQITDQEIAVDGGLGMRPLGPSAR